MTQFSNLFNAIEEVLQDRLEEIQELETKLEEAVKIIQEKDRRIQDQLDTIDVLKSTERQWSEKWATAIRRQKTKPMWFVDITDRAGLVLRKYLVSADDEKAAEKAARESEWVEYEVNSPSVFIGIPDVDEGRQFLVGPVEFELRSGDSGTHQL